MGEPRIISEIFPGVLERAEGLRLFQEYLNAIPASSDRKQAIMDAWELLEIDDEDTALLIQAYGLETA